MNSGPNRIYEFELVRVDHKKKKYILCFDVEAEKQEWMNVSVFNRSSYFWCLADSFQVISQLVSDFLRQEGMARASKGVNKETALLQVKHQYASISCAALCSRVLFTQVRDISRKLEDLNEIYSAGSITQDEFEQREVMRQSRELFA